MKIIAQLPALDVHDLFPLGEENKGGRGIATPLTSIQSFLAKQPLFPSDNERNGLLKNLVNSGFRADCPLQVHPPISTARREAAEAERELLFHNIGQMTTPIVETVDGVKYELSGQVIATVLGLMFHKSKGKLSPVKYMLSAGYRRLAMLIFANCIRFLQGKDLILQVPAVVLDLQNDADLIVASAESNNRLGTQDPEMSQQFWSVLTLMDIGKTMREIENILGKKVQRNFNFVEVANTWPELQIRENFQNDPDSWVKILKAARPVELNKMKVRFGANKVSLEEVTEYFAKLRSIARGEAAGPKMVSKDKLTNTARNHKDSVVKFFSALVQNADEFDRFCTTAAEYASTTGVKLVEHYNAIGIDMSDETIAYILSGQRSSNADTAVEADRIPTA